MSSEKTKADTKEIKQYNRIKIILSVISIVTAIGFLIAVLFTGFSLRLEKWIGTFTSHVYMAFLLFGLILGAVETAITLPLTFYGGYVVEHRFGLSNQSLGRWCLEEIKGMLVGMVLFTPLALLFYFFLRHSPLFWWIPVGCIYFLFSVVLVQLGPVLLFPLFYRFSPMEDESLKRQLQTLSEKVGLHVSGIFSFNLSKNTKKANAAFAGLGRTRRILLADTLLEHFTADEIAAVTGHELGHYRYGHLWKSILFGWVFTLGGLFLSNGLFRVTLAHFGAVRGDELSVLPLLALFLLGFGLVTAPVQNGLSRFFERQADGFVVRETNHSGTFRTALEKLAELNKADREPHPWVEFFFYSHPSLKKRIESIQAMGGKGA